MGLDIYRFFTFILAISIIIFGHCFAANLLQTLQNDPQASQFLAIVSSNKLTGELLTPQTTLFVPNNAAMAAVGNSISDQVAFVKRHIFQFSTNDKTSTTIAVTTSNKDNVFPMTKCDDIGFGIPAYVDGELYWSVAKSSGGNLINQALIVSADKTADNGVYHIISSPLWPAPASGNLKAYFDSAPNNPPITQFAKMWSTIMNRYASNFGRFYNGASTVYFTLFVPVDSAWQDYSSNVMNNILNDPSNNYTALFQLLDAHLLPYQIVFPEWTNVTSTVSSIKLSPGFSPNNMGTLQNDGNNYYVTYGNVRATILSTHNVLVNHGVLHFIDRPLMSFIQTKDGFLQKYASRFYSTCQADTTCQNFLQNSRGSIIAVSDNGMQNWNQMKAGSMNWTNAVGLYFISGQSTLSNMNSGSLLSTQSGSVRVRRLGGITFIDGMVGPGNFMPAKVLMSDFSGSDGNAILVDDVICCAPASGRTIQSYLMQQNGNVSAGATNPSPVLTTTTTTTAPMQGNGSVQSTTKSSTSSSTTNLPLQNFGNGSYSLFLSEWGAIKSYFDLNAEPGYLTLFVPSNAAIQKFRSAGVQYNDLTKRKKILQRHLIPTILNIAAMELSNKVTYELATANYRDLREFIELSVVDNSTATISVRTVKVQVNLNEGGIHTSNGYLYPVEEMLYDQND